MDVCAGVVCYGMLVGKLYVLACVAECSGVYGYGGVYASVVVDEGSGECGGCAE